MWSYKTLFINHIVIVSAYLQDTTNAMSIESSRREMLGRTVSYTFGGIVSAPSWTSPGAAVADDATDITTASFSSYQIFPDASAKLDPSLKKIAPSDLNQVLSMTNTNENGGGALWLGEHHNSAKDHQLQADFVRSIHDQRLKKLGAANNDGSNMSVGLEQVQVQFQPALDAYIAKKISAEEMKSRVEWDKRWSWSFENYLPVFETCRQLNIPLVALNVDSEDLALVELGGFPNLPRDRLQKYISDPAGFAQFASNPYYKSYVDYVISPSYDFHQKLGILKNDMSFSLFFSGRILWDEGMASNAYKWTKANEGGLMVGLVGNDHVKFEGGITGRYQRMADRFHKSENDGLDQQLNCISVILNPSLIDTRTSGSVSMASNSLVEGGTDGLTLQLRYLKKGVDIGSPESRESSNTGGVLALADYIVFSKPS